MKILTVTYGGGHAALIAPVVKELMRRGYDVTVIGLTTAAPYLRELGIPSIGFRDLMEASNHEAYEMGCDLSQGIAGGGLVGKEETIAYLGLNYQELVGRLGKEGAAAEYQKKGRQAFLPIRVMERALAQFKPDLVLATNSPRAERAVILAARACGIPSVCVVDLFALQEVQWIGKPGYATRICVLNEAVKAMFLEHGRKNEEIVVTGNPAFDRLQQPEVKLAGMRLRHKRGWDDGSTTLLWASQPEPEQHPFAPRRGDPALPRQIEDVLRRFVRDNPGFHLVVRYHPSEQVEFAEQQGVIFSPTSENLHVLLHAVDMVIVTASTVGLEASLIGKRVLSVDCSIFTGDAPYSTMGIAHGVAAVADLPLAVRRLHNSLALSPDRRPDGIEKDAVAGICAAVKVADVVESLLKH